MQTLGLNAPVRLLEDMLEPRGTSGSLAGRIRALAQNLEHRALRAINHPDSRLSTTLTLSSLFVRGRLKDVFVFRKERVLNEQMMFVLFCNASWHCWLRASQDVINSPAGSGRTYLKIVFGQNSFSQRLQFVKCGAAALSEGKQNNAFLVRDLFRVAKAAENSLKDDESPAERAAPRRPSEIAGIKLRGSRSPQRRGRIIGSACECSRCDSVSGRPRQRVESSCHRCPVCP
ncbi:hypothetical protein AOLI_G00291020 [Acnodon oligacanthus]